MILHWNGASWDLSLRKKRLATLLIETVTYRNVRCAVSMLWRPKDTLYFFSLQRSYNQQWSSTCRIPDIWDIFVEQGVDWSVLNHSLKVVSFRELFEKLVYFHNVLHNNWLSHWKLWYYTVNPLSQVWIPVTFHCISGRKWVMLHAVFVSLLRVLRAVFSVM